MIDASDASDALGLLTFSFLLSRCCSDDMIRLEVIVAGRKKGNHKELLKTLPQYDYPRY